jgi:hypothetical protein
VMESWDRRFVVRLAWERRTVLASVYFHAQGMGKILTNIFVTNYVDDSLKRSVLGFRDSIFFL